MSTITNLETSTTGVNSRTIINDNFDNLNNGKAELSGDTFTGKVKFSGTDHAGIEVNDLTTEQRNALTPVNGDVIYNTTDSEFEFYQDGSWVSLSGVADASTTVKGIVEEATEAEVVAGTAAGSTGARLAVNPSSISAKILTDVERTLVRALTADATEINQLDGTTNIAEADTFFGATDISGAEAETLTDGSNADSLHIHSYNDKLSISSGATTVGNTQTETDLYTVSLPADQLGTSNGVEIYIPVTAFTTVTSATACTFRLKYGSTTIATVTALTDTGGFPNSGSGFIKVLLSADSATDAQDGVLLLDVLRSGFRDTDIDSFRMVDTGTATEDSTGALTLSVTAQWSDNQASNTITVFNPYAKIIK